MESGVKAVAARRFSAFIQGCTIPSWTGTIGALAVCAMMYLFCCLYVTDRRFIQSPGRFAATDEDEFAFVKARAMRIAHDPRAADQYRVVLIGDSAISQALTSPRDLQRRIERRVGHKVTLTPLLAGGLNQLEAVDLCAMMRDHLRGQVILEISPYNMALAPSRDLYNKSLRSIGIETSDMADEFSRAQQPRPTLYQNFFMRNHAFMLTRISAFMRLLQPTREPNLHPRVKNLERSQQRLEKVARIAYFQTRGMRTKCVPNQALYQRIIEPLTARGLSVALLESPMNPRLLRTKDGQMGVGLAEQRAYRRADHELAAQTGAAIWDLSRKIHFSRDDFIDYAHIRKPETRVRFTEALAARIAACINQPHKEAT
jgi:hypothetical protein